jgi:hypothetical protein
MSDRTRKRIIVASVVALVCGLFVMLLCRKSPDADVTLSLQGFERNQYGVLMGLILVSNTGPHSLLVGTTMGHSYGMLDNRPLEPHTVGVWTVPVPTFGPSRATVMSKRVKSPLIERAKGFIVTTVLRKRPKSDYDVHTLQIRE